MRAGHYSHCIRARCPDRYRLAWVGRSPRRAERAHRPAPAPRATAQTGDFNAIPSAGSPARLPMRAGAVLRGRPVDVGAAAGGVYTPLPAQSSAVVFYRAPLLVLVLLAARRLCGTARCAAAGCCGRERSMSPPTDRRTCPERGVYAAAPVCEWGPGRSQTPHQVPRASYRHGPRCRVHNIHTQILLLCAHAYCVYSHPW